MQDATLSSTQPQPAPVSTSTPWYVSSSGNGLSATIGGLSVVGIAQGVALVAGLVGHPVSQDAVAAGITTIIAAAGAVYAAFGVVRKVYYAFFPTKSA